MLADTKLIGHNLNFQNLVNLYNNNLLPNKILLTGNKGIGKSLFAMHFVNYIFSENEKYKYDLINYKINIENKSYIFTKNNTHPNIYNISKDNDKKSIEISQIRKMIEFQNNSSFNNKSRFIIIDEISYLNIHATNALLKSLEEPNDNVFYILIHNSKTKIKDTLRSRCIEFKLFLNLSSVKSIVNEYFSENIYDTISKDFLNIYSNPSFIIHLINYFKENSLNFSKLTIENLIYFIIKNKHYTKNPFISENISIFVELFFYKNISYTSAASFNIKKYFYLKLNKTQIYNLDLESFFLEFQQKLISE